MSQNAAARAAFKCQRCGCTRHAPQLPTPGVVSTGWPLDCPSYEPDFDAIDRYIDALLAVAKAADDDLLADLAYDAPTNPDLRAALEALDKSHPGWREWTP